MRFLLAFSVYAKRLNNIHFDLFVYGSHLLGEFVQYIDHELAQENHTFVFTLIHFQSLEKASTCIGNICREPVEKFNYAKSKVADL